MTGLAMNDPDSISIHLTAEDVVLCGRSHQVNAMRKTAFFAVIIGLVACCAVIAWIGARYEFWKVFGVVTAGSFVTFAILILLTRWWFIPINAKRHFRQSVSLHEPFLTVFDQDGIRFDSERASARFAWHEFHQWHENSGYFMLYQSVQMYNVIPKRALDDRQIDTVRSYLETKGPKRV